MGLPLFVAPVESDLKPKPSAKNGVLSPTRSGIMRRMYNPHRQERQERQSRRHVRIQAALNQAYPTGTDGISDSSGDRLTSARRAGFRVHDSGARRSADRATSTAAQPSRHLDASSNEANWLEPNVSMSELERRPLRNALREITQSNDPQQRRRWEEQMGEIFGGSWQEGSRDYVRMPSPREAGHVSYIRRESRGITPWQRAPRYSPENSGLLSLFNSTSQGAFTDPTPPPPAPRPARLDGLGDRQRSPSPEGGWDTLLSTLTPDPQAPSANSSFTSAPTPRHNGLSAASSHTTPSADPLRVPPFDPHCEEGRENTDDDDDGQAIWTRRRPAQVSWDPELSFAENMSRNARHDWRYDIARNPPIWLPSSSEHASPSDTEQTEGTLRPQRLRDREREREQRAEASGTGTDEEWSGMQHIVRRLANRDDIPDEWWAEVGLSRTLPRDEGNP